MSDVAEAVAFYEHYLDFTAVHLAQDGSAAIMRRDGSAIMLCRATAGDTARREPHAWDAIIDLRDFDAAHAQLSVRGVELVGAVTTHPMLGRTLTVADRYGNLLGLREAPDHLGTPLRRRLRQARARLSSSRFERSALVELRPHRERFAEFYRQLDNHQDVFYMFFTTGLLHWVVKAASYVPASVNLVLLGSDLSDEERAFVRTRLNRPFHHIDHLVSDWPVWDWLLTTNENSFGWLDIDCLVLNNAIFTQITDIAPNASVNCVWSYESGHGYRIANTYLVYVNAAAVRALRERGVPVWARPHDWLGGDRSEHDGPRCFYRVPTARERRLMLTVTPADARGRPRSPGSRSFFDTLSVYQILARAAGFRVHQVRGLENPMLGPVDPGQPPRLEPQEMSDELVHVGGISYYTEHFHNPDVRVRYLEADYVILRDLAPRLPADYGERLRAVAAELSRFGVDPEHAQADLRAYLGEIGGLSHDAIEKVLAAPGG